MSHFLFCTLPISGLAPAHPTLTSLFALPTLDAARFTPAFDCLPRTRLMSYCHHFCFRISHRHVGVGISLVYSHGSNISSARRISRSSVAYSGHAVKGYRDPPGTHWWSATTVYEESSKGWPLAHFPGTTGAYDTLSYLLLSLAYLRPAPAPSHYYNCGWCIYDTPRRANGPLQLFLLPVLGATRCILISDVVRRTLGS